MNRAYLLICLLTLQTAVAVPYTVSDPGYGRYYDGHRAHYHQSKWNLYSGVYNQRQYGQAFGHNPHYVRNERGGIDSMRIRSQLDMQFHKNQELFRPRASVGPIGY